MALEAVKKQPELEGFERPVHPEIDKLALKYVGVRTKRMELQDQENKLKAELHQAMVLADMKRYQFMDGEETREVVVETGKDKVKVQFVESE